MKRIGIIRLACSALTLFLCAGAAHATPVVNGATVETRTFNDCPISTVTASNNYPASVSITDVMDPLCVGFANLHSFSFSADGGTTAAVFDNNSNFTFGADFKIDGAGEGEGGLRLSPWYGKFVDGRFMANATTGEIACFGGAIPFYSFTVGHGITYTKGTTIRFEMTYRAHGLSPGNPASIQYRAIYNGNTYDSPVLLFGQQNPNECDPNSLWGMLNDGRAGGYFQARANTGASLSATWSNITYSVLAGDGTPSANGAIVTTRTFNDCPISVVSSSNNYPASVSITDVMDPLCVGFANLHSFSYSADGGGTAAVIDNNARFSFGADFKIDGAGEGEGGMRLSPWYGQFVDGRFMANATSGEIACFGGAVPFYSFTVGHGITYTKGTTIRLEVTYDGHDNTEANPATIQYRAIYNGNTYDSPVLPFGKQNAAECVHGLWGNLNDGRAGGYFQVRANTGASLTGTWSNITYSTCFASVGLAFNPEVMNLNSHGNFVTAVLEPAAPYGPGDIDVSSLRLNGSVSPSGPPASVGDADHDGIPDLTVKFSRSAVAALLSAGNAVTVSVGGSIGIDCFVANDVIKVKAATLPAPAAGSVVAAGSTVKLTWDKDNDPSLVDVIASYDNGVTWNVAARNVPNNGKYDWHVPNVSTSQARVGITTVISESGSDLVTGREFGESGAFRIEGATGVGNDPIAFALYGVRPNPGHGSLNVTFSLPSGAPAKLAVYDVSGREMVSRDVSGLGAGRHVVSFGQYERMPAGVYLVHLSQGGHSLKMTAVVIE
jgi:hypothetical protein